MTQVAPASTTSSGNVTNLTVTAPRPSHRSGFGELLHELNPLQYLPVIGTIYRAVTHDQISDEARTAGSLVVSGLTGGPAGVAISLATMAVEKLTGLDPEKIAQSLLSHLGIGGAGPHPPAATIVQAAAPPAPEAKAWSPTQLAAYGITTTPSGTLAQGALTGSDVLNALELQRLAPGSLQKPTA